MNTLYKKDSKEKMRFLDISTDGSTIVQVSGLLEGKHTTSVSQCEPKNIGRSNETTGDEQAEIEAEAKYVKKLKEGYFTSEQEAQDTVVMLPMLAKVFGKEERKVEYPCFAQPKLDGMRALNSSHDPLLSRSGNVISTVPHVQTVDPDGPNIILDGELYAHGLSFQENMRIIKKTRPETINVKHHVYDMVSDKPFAERYNDLQKHVQRHEHLLLVDTVVILNKEQLMKYHADNISKGYEGTIVRWGNEGYKLNGRSSNLLKLKDFSDLALPLLDVVPSEKRPTHGKPIFYWKGAENNEMGAGISLSHSEAEDLLANKEKHIGKMCELRFFEYSDTGVPRHPVMYGFRLDK
tara:strand:+ start:140 stop:1189 length:1050 start_codon:yes stop_codon:yes gene_type:complete